jgi:hypothetical protein
MGTKSRMFLILALEECEWLVSRSNHFIPPAISPHTSIGGYEYGFLYALRFIYIENCFR